MKRLLSLILAVLLCATLFVGCDKVVFTGTTTAQNNKGDSQMTYEPKDTTALLDINDIPEPDETGIDDDYQSRDPKPGETIAIISTNYGEIRMRFLDKIAPLATNNFIALANDGRYDKTIFHRVINEFMIQCGDYTNFDGTGGASAYGHEFENEVSEYASNIRGSVAMANAGPDTNGSQFYINQCHTDNAYLDGGYTVFGWVYEGMDVVDAIANVTTDSYDKPLEDVIIEYVEITEFEG